MKNESEMTELSNSEIIYLTKFPSYITQYNSVLQRLHV